MVIQNEVQKFMLLDFIIFCLYLLVNIRFTEKDIRYAK